MFRCALILEDDADVAHLIRDGLRREGMDVLVAGNLGEAREAMDRMRPRPDVCLVDRVLPDGDGLEFVHELRSGSSEVAIVVLTGMGGSDHVVAGLDRGADLYLTKPFTTAELTAHLRALHRRTSGQDRRHLHFGGIQLDKVERVVHFRNRKIRLTDVEARLLGALMVRRGDVASRTELFSEVWELDFDPGTGLLHSHMRNLRARLRSVSLEDSIAAVRGVGYQLLPPDPD